MKYFVFVVMFFSLHCGELTKISDQELNKLDDYLKAQIREELELSNAINQKDEQLKNLKNELSNSENPGIAAFFLGCFSLACVLWKLNGSHNCGDNLIEIIESVFPTKTGDSGLGLPLIIPFIIPLAAVCVPLIALGDDRTFYPVVGISVALFLVSAVAAKNSSLHKKELTEQIFKLEQELTPLTDKYVDTQIEIRELNQLKSKINITQRLDQDIKKQLKNFRGLKK